MCSWKLSHFLPVNQSLGVLEFILEHTPVDYNPSSNKCLQLKPLWKHDLAQTGYKGLKMQNCENFAEIRESCLINETCELIPHVQFHLCKS